MFGRLLCALGFHRWAPWEWWYPSFSARIVTHCQMGADCVRCGKRQIDVDYHYEED